MHRAPKSANPRRPVRPDRLRRPDGPRPAAPAGQRRARLGRDVSTGLMRLAPANGERPDARLAADPATWRRIADDVRGGMEAFRRGRLKMRDDLHLGVGFLAATSG